MDPVTAAKDFFRAGGQLGWGHWTTASREQQQAWLTAKEAVRIEELFQLVQALSGPEGLADVMSPIDNGRGLDRLQLVQAVKAAAEKLR